MLVWGLDSFILSLLYLKLQNCKFFCQITCDLLSIRRANLRDNLNGFSDNNS